MQIFDVFLLEAVINGILLGGILALLALGLNLIFGVIDVVWICYAELIMIGMYSVYYAHNVYHWPLALAFLGCILLVAALGALLHVLVIRPVLGAEPINQLLVTGGVLFFLQAVATLAFGPGLFDSPWLSGIAAVLVAGLMVSRLPTYSFKRIKVPQHFVLPTLLVVGALAAFLVSSPWLTLLGVSALYVASLPLSWLAYRRLSHNTPVAMAHPAELAEDSEIDEPDELMPH